MATLNVGRLLQICGMISIPLPISGHHSLRPSVAISLSLPSLVIEDVPMLQERIRIPDDKMSYYTDLAEMYVGDDVSPDFYGWVFPKYDHVAVGTGTVVNKAGIKQYQLATRARSKVLDCRRRLLFRWTF